MRVKQCPQCHQSISLALLKSTGTHKAFIKRQGFLCPHCETAIRLPQKAEKLVSVGILCSLIFAPLSYYLLTAPTLGYLLFINGAILILIGSFTNKLSLATPTAITKMPPAELNKESKEELKENLNKELDKKPEDETKETRKEKNNND
ncbi:MAG: hypothetical protein ACJAUT_000171 [Cellvibrionaceae bacterium]|jgi:hypothetical protein